jgi:hypothetical protein
MSGVNYLTLLPYYEAGVFTVGSGNSISGRDDFYGATFTGGYSIISNGTGTITVNVNGVGTLIWAITLTGSGSLYVMEADNAANSAGTAYQQDATAITATPSGTFVFRTHVTTPSVVLTGSKATAGLMTWAAGAITGQEDVLVGGSMLSNGGSLNPPTAFTSTSVVAPDSTGTGSIQLSDGTHYNYYIIDANTMLLLEVDGNIGFGRAEMQSGTFTVASLPAGAGYVFGSQGDSSATIAANALGGANSVGQFTVDGNGNINSGGTLDAVHDGTVAALTINAGTYIPDATVNGRYLFNLGTSGVNVQEAVYMVNSSRGFFVVANDSTRVEDGTMEQQQASSFATGDLKGEFAFVMGGDVLPTVSSNIEFLDRSGTVTSDGNGNLGWAEVANANGSIATPGCLAGTYSMSSNGRATGQVPGLPADLVFYLASSSKVYLLQNDSTVQINGGMVQQSSAVVDPPGTFVKKRPGH